MRAGHDDQAVSYLVALGTGERAPRHLPLLPPKHIDNSPSIHQTLNIRLRTLRPQRHLIPPRMHLLTPEVFHLTVLVREFLLYPHAVFWCWFGEGFDSIYRINFQE